MSKYHSKKTLCDGILFDSKKEANRYMELKMLKRAGEIEHLRLQPVFKIYPSFVYQGKKYPEIKYIADFMYKEGNTWIVEDVKGVRTAVYQIKKKMFLYAYGNEYKFVEI